jgi:hypothetical protein
MIVERRSGVVVLCLAAALSLLPLTSCHDFGPCAPFRLAPTSVSAADQATSCQEAVSYEGHDYTPWCVTVRRDLLADSPDLRGGDVVHDYRARLIVGVPPEQAIAVAKTELAPPDGTTRRLQREPCGAWRFAPERDLSTKEATRIARRVTVPGTLHMN